MKKKHVITVSILIIISSLFLYLHYEYKRGLYDHDNSRTFIRELFQGNEFMSVRDFHDVDYTDVFLHEYQILYEKGKIREIHDILEDKGLYIGKSNLSRKFDLGHKTSTTLPE